jgi:pimeloyl-ACP methyl ester carboxylesterase
MRTPKNKKFFGSFFQKRTNLPLSGGRISDSVADVLAWRIYLILDHRGRYPGGDVLMQKVERRFVEVGGRRVHYRRVGIGPPVVMLHASPASSEMLLGEMRAAAAHFTCYAFDMPGFGDSDALPGDTVGVRDVAAATAAAMQALGLPACPVFGTHSGTAIALELAVGWPESVTGLVLDGVPLFNDAEMDEIFADYFTFFPPDPLGGHFVRTWIRFRDQFTWFPWNSRDVRRLNAIDRPAPADIQHWMMMFLRGFRTSLPVYRAVCYHGAALYEAAKVLACAAVYMATEEDMLFGHLDRLPPLKAGQQIARLPADTAAKHKATVGFLQVMPAAPPAPMPAPTRMAGRDPAVQFLDTEDGQIFIRCYGDCTKPALFLLHDSPGTGLKLQDLARSLSLDAYVILPDLPGTGESDAPGEDRAILEVSADALSAIADTLALEGFGVAAFGCGCAVAAVFASRGDPRLTGLVLQDVPVPDAGVAEVIAPDVELSPEGAHWLKFWLMVRDAEVYRPWFDGRVAAQRGTQGNFDADWLHEQTFALMKSRETYHRIARAAYRLDIEAALSRAAVPVHRVAGDDVQAAIQEVLPANGR